MKASVEKIEKNRVTLEVEVEPEVMATAMQKAYTKLVKQVNIPGFRKGKVPRKVLENYIGTEPLMEEAVENVVPNAYLDAVAENAIEPIDQPNIEMVQLEDGKPVIFKATVDVKPEVTLGDYKGIEVAKKVDEVTDEDVDRYLKTLQERYAKLVVLEENEAAAADDTAVIDFEGFVDGEAFEGGKGEEHPLVLGAGSFIPGFEEQLIGASAGEEKDVTVTFPEDYQAENLAGKEAVFKVKVKEIKRKEFAPMDDEFAKDVSEFETLEELKSDTRNKLETTAQQQGEAAFRSAVIDLVADNAETEVPEQLVGRRMEQMMDNFSRRLEQQGMNMEQYMEYTQSSLEDFKKQYRPEAVKSVKSDLVLEAVAHQENVEVTEEDINAEIEKMAKMYNQDVESLKAIMAAQDSLDSLEYGIMLDKAADLLVANAVPVPAGQEETPGEKADKQE